MREIINRISMGGLTAVYRRESETGVVELVLLPTGCEGDIVRTDCAAEPLVQAKLETDDAPTFSAVGAPRATAPPPALLCSMGRLYKNLTIKRSF